MVTSGNPQLPSAAKPGSEARKVPALLYTPSSEYQYSVLASFMNAKLDARKRYKDFLVPASFAALGLIFFVSDLGPPIIALVLIAWMLIGCDQSEEHQYKKRLLDIAFQLECSQSAPCEFEVYTTLVKNKYLRTCIKLNCMDGVFHPSKSPLKFLAPEKSIQGRGLLIFNPQTQNPIVIAVETGELIWLIPT